MRKELEFWFPVAEEMVDYVSDIVYEMSRIFQIPTEEAVRILNQHWDGLAIGSADIIGHEEPDYWARTIYGQYRT